MTGRTDGSARPHRLRRTVATVAMVAAVVAGTLGGASAPPAAAAIGGEIATAAVRLPSTRIVVPADDWLGALNAYRAASGLDMVVEEPSWSAGIAEHLVYLRNTPLSLRVGEYANLHTQNPTSPWYTAAGDAAGRASNLGYGATELQVVEGWMQGPFHAIGMVRPHLRRSGFASDGYAAGLDVIRGLDHGASPPAAPVVFPGNGAANFIDRFEGELPDPTEPCGAGFGAGRSGMPLFVLLPERPGTGTTAQLTLPSGRTVTEGRELCVVTADTFVSTDSIYGSTGAAILRAENAVLVISASPLAPGRHRVEVRAPGQPTVDWTFTQVTSFDDVDHGSRSLTSVRWLTANGITGGITATEYGPNQPVTRAQMAAFLHRFAGEPSTSAPLRFTDVHQDAYYAAAVRWLTDQGITGGITTTEYGPNQPVTRAQMAAFLHRFAGEPSTSAPLRFTDVHQDAYYAAAVRWLTDQGITGGITATEYGPNQPVTRAQMAAFLQRFDTSQRS